MGDALVADMGKGGAVAPVQEGDGSGEGAVDEAGRRAYAQAFFSPEKYHRRCVVVTSNANFRKNHVSFLPPVSYSKSDR